MDSNPQPCDCKSCSLTTGDHSDQWIAEQSNSGFTPVIHYVQATDSAHQAKGIKQDKDKISCVKQNHVRQQNQVNLIHTRGILTIPCGLLRD